LGLADYLVFRGLKRDDQFATVLPDISSKRVDNKWIEDS